MGKKDVVEDTIDIMERDLIGSERLIPGDLPGSFPQAGGRYPSQGLEEAITARRADPMPLGA